MDHSLASCPYRIADDHSPVPAFKRDRPTGPERRRPPPFKKPRPHNPKEACRKWNRYNYIAYPHGSECHYAHICSNCQSPDHGLNKYPTARTEVIWERHSASSYLFIPFCMSLASKTERLLCVSYHLPLYLCGHISPPSFNCCHQYGTLVITSRFARST